jgi:hypothetical protein
MVGHFCTLFPHLLNSKVEQNGGKDYFRAMVVRIKPQTPIKCGP